MGWRTKAQLVRLHFADGAPSIDGIYDGLKAGHYRLLNPSIVDAEDVSVAMDGEAWVPRERVLFMQVTR